MSFTSTCGWASVSNYVAPGSRTKIHDAESHPTVAGESLVDANSLPLGDDHNQRVVVHNQ
jgi:hypothetical protein